MTAAYPNGPIAAPKTGDLFAPTVEGAHFRISTHEILCGERYANLYAVVAATAARTAKLEALLWICAGTLICGMATLLGAIAFKQVHM